MKSLVAVLVASIGTLGVFGAAYFTSKSTADSRVNEVVTKVEVLQERQSLQYTEVKESLARIEKKIDKLPLGLQAISLK